MAVPLEHRATGSNLSSDVALERLRVGQDNLTSSRTNAHSLAVGLASNINKHFQPAAVAPACNPSTHAAEAKDCCRSETSWGYIVSPSQLQSKTLPLFVFEIII